MGFFVIVMLVILAFTYLSNYGIKSNTITYSQYQLDVTEGKVTSAGIVQNKEIPSGQIYLQYEGKVQKTVYVADINQESAFLQEYGIKFVMRSFGTYRRKNLFW